MSKIGFLTFVVWFASPSIVWKRLGKRYIMRMVLMKLKDAFDNTQMIPCWPIVGCSTIANIESFVYHPFDLYSLTKVPKITKV